MRSGLRGIFSFAFAFVLFSSSPALAQNSSWGDVTVSAGRVDYDLSGVGNAPGFAVATKKHLTSNIALELRGLFARPCQQFQDCETEGPATLFVPEAQLQYRWFAGRFEPFVGAGLGASWLRASFDSDWAPTVSFSAGTGVRLTDRLALTGEFRLRGHEYRFTGTTTEVNAGLTWTLPFSN